ncbi:hypothetical protein GQ457_02G031930 [Hibiscus cannabinus]
MSDYMPEEVIVGILKRLPAKSVVRFRSVCKGWDTLISDPWFISTHLQASLSNNTSFLLFLCVKNGKTRFSLHYDQDGFEESKQLHLPPFSSVFGSCNGLICVQLFSFVVDFLLWNPSIQNYLYWGVDEGNSWIQPYLFSLKENCWKRVRAVQPDYAFRRQTSLPFVNGAVHWLGNRKRNVVDTAMPFWAYAELHDLWVMKEYGVVESWTKVLTLHRVVLNTDFPRVMGFRKNGQVLLQEHYLKIVSLGLNSQQIGASLHLNCQEIELPGLHFWTDLFSVDNYVESLVLLDKALHVRRGSDVNHPIYLSDSDESNGGESGTYGTMQIHGTLKHMSAFSSRGRASICCTESPLGRFHIGIHLKQTNGLVNFKQSLKRKSSLIDSLAIVAAVGIIAQEIIGDVRMTNTSADKDERGITIKSTCISLSTPG